MSNNIEQRIQGLSSMIGNTPLLAIEYVYKGRQGVVYVKAENMSLTGSIKDRMAFHILRKGYERGLLKPGKLIVEATSGNTGISVSAIGRALGHPVVIFMPDWMSRERINLIQSFGAKINLISKEQGGFLGSIRMADELADATEGAFLPRQFSNEDNVEAHFLTTGPELWWQMKYRNLKPDAFIAGVGTGGTIMGVGKFLKKMNPAIKLYPLEPANSPTLSTGYKVGKHRIQGISDEFIPSIVKLNELDEIIAVEDGDAIIMAANLAKTMGIGVGISSGANFLGAIKVQEKLGPQAIVATIFADSNKKYLSTDLLRDEPVRDNYLAPKVVLNGFKSYRRVCHTCCEPVECIELQYFDKSEEDNLSNLCPRIKKT